MIKLYEPKIYKEDVNLVNKTLKEGWVSGNSPIVKDFENKNNVICKFHYHEQSIVKTDFYCEEKGDKCIVYPWETQESDEIQDYLKEENIDE